MKIWKIESSWMVAIPPNFEATSIEDLCNQIQAVADRKHVNKSRPPIGQLTFNLTRDDEGRIHRVNAYFRDKHDMKKRFMRVSTELVAV